MTTKHGDEYLASLVLRATLGVSVIYHDDGTQPGMYDLEINYPDGRQAAAEVVSTRDRAAWDLEATISKLGYVRCPQLGRMWLISVDPGAKVKKLAQAAPKCLAQLERDGIDRLGRNFFDPWPRELRAFGTVTCASCQPTERHPPGFYILSFPSAAWVDDGDKTARSCAAFLKKVPDVTAKLAASGLAERHVVVIVTTDWLGALVAIEDGKMPTVPPELPSGVTCLPNCHPYIAASADFPMPGIPTRLTTGPAVGARVSARSGSHNRLCTSHCSRYRPTKPTSPGGPSEPPLPISEPDLRQRAGQRRQPLLDMPD